MNEEKAEEEGGRVRVRVRVRVKRKKRGGREEEEEGMGKAEWDDRGEEGQRRRLCVCLHKHAWCAIT